MAPSVIGPGCKVEAGCQIGEYAVLGSNVRVQAEANIARSVLHDNVYVGTRTRIRGATIGRTTSIRNNVRIDEGVVLGDEVFVGSNAVVSGDVKVYPFKTIEDGAVVNSSIVWESRGARSLFGRDGVTGLANVDVTPELAVRVAMAYGTSLPKGTTVDHVARLQPGGTDAQAGDDGRAQRLGDRRARPRGRQRAGHPLPGALATGLRRA